MQKLFSQCVTTLNSVSDDLKERDKAFLKGYYLTSAPNFTSALLKSFLEGITHGFNENANPPKAIQYITISFLINDYISENYRIRIDFYDGQFFNDMQPLSSFLGYDFLADHHRENIKLCQDVLLENRSPKKLMGIDEQMIKMFLKGRVSLQLETLIGLALHDDMTTLFFDKLGMCNSGIAISYGYYKNKQKGLRII